MQVVEVYAKQGLLDHRLTVLMPTVFISRKSRHSHMRMKALLGASILWASAAALADEGAADYRHHTMDAIGGHLSAVVDIFQGKVAHQAHLAAHARAIAEMAAIADTLFPEGSIGGNAKAAIWEQPEAFAEHMQAFQKAAPAFRDAVVGGGDIGGAFQTLGQACKGCHDDFKDE